MNELEIRSASWDYAVHGEGTSHVFQRRADRLENLATFRDFLGLAVPIITASAFTAPFLPVMEPAKPYIFLLLAGFGLIQVLLSAFSLTRGWDAKRSYAARSARDNFEIRVAWERLAKGESKDFQSDYDALKRRQDLLDTHDAEKGITNNEKQRGMRAGLLAFQRPCVCGDTPKTLAPPMRLLRKKECPVCGGN